MNEMIERVGLAIYHSLGTITGDEAAEAARAAIEAMREPTEAMVTEGAGSIQWNELCNREDQRSDTLEAWQSMIDAALSDA